MMDLQKFLNASLTMREATIPVPKLAEFFGDEKPEWKVRGLTAAELARANDASKAASNLNSLVEALASGEKADALRKLAGVPGKDVPMDVSRRIQALVEGSVSPKLDEESRDVAVRLAETFPNVFYELTNQIFTLTGEGAEVGKRKPSGKKAESEA
jgi:hypothetical protein